MTFIFSPDIDMTDALPWMIIFIRQQVAEIENVREENLTWQ